MYVQGVGGLKLQNLSVRTLWMMPKAISALSSLSDLLDEIFRFKLQDSCIKGFPLLRKYVYTRITAVLSYMFFICK